MSGYFDDRADQVRRNPESILEVEKEVWKDVLRTINIPGFPPKFRQAVFLLKDAVMYDAVTADDFIQSLKSTYKKNGTSLFIEIMHDLFHVVREYSSKNGLNVVWDDVYDRKHFGSFILSSTLG